MDDHFESKIPQLALGPLLQLGSEFGFDPTISEEAEQFFNSLLGQFRGAEIEIEEWLRGQLRDRFKSLSQMPRWIQNPSWQFTDFGPMVFVGQLDVPAGIFHDEASFYTFFEPKTGVARSIVQVA